MLNKICKFYSERYLTARDKYFYKKILTKFKNFYFSFTYALQYSYVAQNKIHRKTFA
jgi:hypothetical protein